MYSYTHFYECHLKKKYKVDKRPENKPEQIYTESRRWKNLTNIA